MATQVMFGNTGANAPARAPVATATAQPMQTMVTIPHTNNPTDNPYAGQDNLNEFDFGRTFAAPYAQGSSMIVVFVLWLFFGSFGAHRLYMGNKWIAMAMGGLGTFNGLLWLTGGVTAYLSYKAGTGIMSGGLISAVVVMIIHFSWVFFDFFYILVRKLTSR